jgi:energy-converting hydrogenase Eha subunit A
MFTLVVSMMQILVFIAAIAGIYTTSNTTLSLPTKPFTAPDFGPPYRHDEFAWVGTFSISYLVLAIADVHVIIFSIILLYGIEPKRPCRCYFYPWIVFFPFYIIYESALNISFFYMTFTGMISIPGANFGYVIVPLVYWPIKEITILVFWFIVIFYAVEVSRTIKAEKSGKIAGSAGAAPVTPAGHPQHPPHMDDQYMTPRVPFYQVAAAASRPDPMTNYGYMSRCEVAPALSNYGGRPSYCGGGAYRCQLQPSSY